jgi:peptidoglycan hydrolase-like protein with peptidoglycan-binding domain
MRSADAIGAQSPLGASIVYDSTVHGSWPHVRDLTRKAHGELVDIGEKEWMAHYVDERRNWLATHPNALLHKTVYRMDAFRTLLAEDNWPLALAFAVRGLSINEDALGQSDPVKVTADGAPRRLLRLKSPPLTGADVSWLQERLARAGIPIAASGTFDTATDEAVRAFQSDRDLKADGVVGPVTRGALEDLSVTAPVAIDVPDQPMPAIAVPVVIAPYPVIAHAPIAEEPAPAAQTQDAEPPHGASAPATPSHPAAPAPDAIADLKQHVTNEVQAGIESVKSNVSEQQAKIVQNLLAGNLQGALAQIDQGRTFFQRIFANGRGFTAALLSVLTLAFTEGRDFLAWSKATNGQANDVYAFMGHARDWATQTYINLHALAAAVPNDWVFRLRVAALALIAYAVTRFARRRNVAPARKK